MSGPRGPNPELYWQSEEATRLNDERYQRDQERLRYDREQYDRNGRAGAAAVAGGVVASQSSGIAEYFTLAVFATFPRARRLLLITCLVGIPAGLLLLFIGAALPADNNSPLFAVRLLMLLGGLGCTGLSFFAIIFLWIPSTIAAYVVPKMRDRWLGIDDEEEE